MKKRKFKQTRDPNFINAKFKTKAGTHQNKKKKDGKNKCRKSKQQKQQDKS
jgi:hypothetical protein